MSWEVLKEAAVILRGRGSIAAAQECETLSLTLHVEELKNSANCWGCAALMNRYEGCEDIPDSPHRDDYSGITFESAVVPDEVLESEFERGWLETAEEIRKDREEGKIGPTEVCDPRRAPWEGTE